MLLLPMGLMAPAPSVLPPRLLDSVSAFMVGAFGMRLLRANYIGPAIRVRRSSDNSERDIGFVSGLLDTASLLTFCGQGDGFLSKWYDQTSLGQDLGQVTAANQPRVVTSGVVATLSGAPLGVTSNGTARPAALFASAVQQSLALDGFAIGGSAYAAAAVACKKPQGNFYPRLLSYTAPGTNDYSSTASVVFAYCNGGEIRGYQSGLKSSAAIGSTPFQLASVWDGASNILTIDGVAAAPVGAGGTLSATGLLAVGIGAGEAWEGAVAEVIVISGALSGADQATIRTSQRTYYGTP